jgi:hypothetical protein
MYDNMTQGQQKKSTTAAKTFKVVVQPYTHA